MAMSRRRFTARLASVLGLAAVGCRKGSTGDVSPEARAGEPGDAPPELPWTPRIPRMALGSEGAAHLAAKRLRVFDPETGAVRRELPLAQGLALTALSDGSLLVADRVEDGIGLHHLLPGQAPRALEPKLWGALLPREIDALYPHPGDAGRFRVASDGFRTLHQVSLTPVAGMLAPDAVVRLQRTMEGPLLALRDGRFLYAEGGAFYRQALGVGGALTKNTWEQRHLLRLCEAAGKDEIWAAAVDGTMARVLLGEPARTVQTFRSEDRVEDMDADADGLALITATMDARGAVRRQVSALDSAGQARWKVPLTQDLGGARSVVLSPGVVLVSGDAGWLGWSRESGATRYQG